MKRVSFVLLSLAFVVALAWPLSSAIGLATGTTSRMELRPTACVPDPAATSWGGAEGPDGAELALPPGHPAIARELPPGHPAIDLPPGHPPIGEALPPGHPPIPSGHDRDAPSGDLIEAPALLTI